MDLRVWPGRPYPLGATWDGSGVNFALFSEFGTKVELCLFDSPTATKESHRIEMKEQTDMVWHAYLPDVEPAQLYGYRVHGPYEPLNGHRFNPNKVILDPYAKGIGRDVIWNDALYGYTIGKDDLSFDERDSAPYAPPAPVLATPFTWGAARPPGKDDLSFDERDSAPYAPLASVIDTAFTWGDDRPPRTPWHKTLIYEAHVKGLTSRHPEVPEDRRGTYAGLASDAVI